MRRLLRALLCMAAAGASAAALVGETNQHARTHPHQSGATTGIHLLVKLCASSAPTTAPGAAVPTVSLTVTDETGRTDAAEVVNHPVDRYHYCSGKGRPGQLQPHDQRAGRRVSGFDEPADGHRLRDLLGHTCQHHLARQ